MLLEKQITNSSNVSAISYKPKEQQMFVTFKTQAKYVYMGVPVEVWQEALEAPSIGTFVHTVLKPKYHAKPIR